MANDALLSGVWQLEACWKWKKPHHIKVLESQAYVTMLRVMAKTGRGARFTALLDSRVAKGSHAKGRSSAKALKPTLSQSTALQVAFGLYPALGFAPTRLNVADDPSRDQQIRPSVSHSITSAITLNQCRALHAMGFSRSTANWVRPSTSSPVAWKLQALSTPLWTLRNIQPLYGLCATFMEFCCRRRPSMDFDLDFHPCRLAPQSMDFSWPSTLYPAHCCLDLDLALPHLAILSLLPQRSLEPPC